MSVLDWFTSAPKVVDNVFDKEKGLLTQVGQWVGHQQFTDEEKAKHSAAIGESVRAYAVATLNENTDRSKTRRELAVKWFNMQIKLVWLTVLAVMIDKLAVLLERPDIDLTGAVTAIAFSGLLWSITSGIGLFFWGSHALRSSKLAK